MRIGAGRTALEVSWNGLFGERLRMPSANDARAIRYSLSDWSSISYEAVKWSHR